MQEQNDFLKNVSLELIREVDQLMLKNADTIKNVNLELNREKFKHINCDICGYGFLEDDEICIVLKCDHVFHIDCFRNWIQKCKRKCPSCKILVQFYENEIFKKIRQDYSVSVSESYSYQGRFSESNTVNKEQYRATKTYYSAHKQNSTPEGFTSQFIQTQKNHYSDKRMVEEDFLLYNKEKSKKKAKKHEYTIDDHTMVNNQDKLDYELDDDGNIIFSNELIKNKHRRSRKNDIMMSLIHDE